VCIYECALHFLNTFFISFFQTCNLEWTAKLFFVGNLFLCIKKFRIPHGENALRNTRHVRWSQLMINYITFIFWYRNCYFGLRLDQELWQKILTAPTFCQKFGSKKLGFSSGNDNWGFCTLSLNLQTLFLGTKYNDVVIAMWIDDIIPYIVLDTFFTLGNKLWCFSCSSVKP